MFTACPQLVSHMNLVMSHYHISFPCSLQCKTRCVFGWGQFSMGDAVLPCQSLLLLFLSVCRGILDEPQLGCFWHWRSWDLDSGCSAQVPWHVIHTLFSNLHWGSEGFLPPGGNTRFRAQHSLWVAGGRWSFPVEPFHCSPMYNPFISFFIHREGCCLFTSYQKGSRGERQEAFAPALCCPLVLAGYAIPTCHAGSCWSLSLWTWVLMNLLLLICFLLSLLMQAARFGPCSAGDAITHHDPTAATVSWRKLSFLGGSRACWGTIVGKSVAPSPREKNGWGQNCKTKPIRLEQQRLLSNGGCCDLSCGHQLHNLNCPEESDPWKWVLKLFLCSEGTAWTAASWGSCRSSTFIICW